MAPRSRKHLIAWPGLIAMWLIVLAPLVSQFVAAAHRDDAATTTLCSAVQSSDTSVRATHDGLLAACGYCDLLADHAALPTLMPAVLVLLTLVARAAAPAPSSRFAPPGAFPSGRPRAPPILF